jgi:hypothetical protein
MDPEKNSIATNVWLDGNPVFSLTYKGRRGEDVYNDLSGFRPDPADYLVPGIKYHAHLVFNTEKDYQNKDQWVLRYVYVKNHTPGQPQPSSDTQKFAYIR